jgi:hypothetical protein
MTIVRKDDFAPVEAKGYWSVIRHRKPRSYGPARPALIGPHGLSFARVGAVLQMKAGDHFVQSRRRWVRLHEKGGKEHDVPCHHNLDHFLDEYIAAAGVAADLDGNLFRAAARKTDLFD